MQCAVNSASGVWTTELEGLSDSARARMPGRSYGDLDGGDCRRRRGLRTEGSTPCLGWDARVRH